MSTFDARNIFGVAMTVIYVRSLPYSAYTTRLMLEGVAKGFDLSETDGDAIYNYYHTEGQPESTEALFSIPYITYEAQVQSIIDDYLPDVVQSHRELLTIAAHAMIFGYTLNPSINITDFQKLLGDVLGSIAYTVFGQGLFRVVDRVVITPFSSYSVLNTLLQNDYHLVIKSIGQEARTVEVALTNYNWYDTTNILHGPNLQIMKDVENQYYYLSGKMIYEGAFGSVDPCIEDTTTISTWSGDATFSYIRNTPCRQNDSYIGPVNYITFNRIFNDGPASSGYYSGAISGFYMDNDRAVLDPQDYQTNSHSLFPYTGGLLCDNVFTNANGPYGLLNGDYLNAPYSWGCSVPFQRMHIGDNLPRYICDAKTCVCTLQNVTGFKFVSLSLPNEIWASDLQFRQTNPISDFSSILKRAWNISDTSPYISTPDGDNVLWPYFLDIDLNQFWYVGYPVLNGINDLPELAFFQTFENPTFGEGANIVLYPSIGKGVGNYGEFSDTDRSYSVGSRFLFSGGGALPITFKQHVSSNLSGFDSITQKFFGMGTAFSGKYSIDLSSEENAGFFYTGFSVFENGLAISSTTLADNFKTSVVGGKYKTIKYISGYKRIVDGETFGLTNKFAKDSTGNIYTYAYFDADSLPMATFQEDNWSYFAPVPSDFENTSLYERVYAEHTVENYLPRFYDGPFSSEQRKFLYPNAKLNDAIYMGKNNGIPTRVHFKVKVREETVKEIYGKYTIATDGSISAIATPVKVIRSDTPINRKSNPIMDDIFKPNSPADYFDYNFNFWGQNEIFNSNAAIGELVDNNWAPLIASQYIPSGKNNTVYNSSASTFELFEMGLKKLYQFGAQTHIQYGSLSSYRIFYTPRPIVDGLFHAFDYVELSGMLTYTLPVFDLEKNAIVANDGILSAFPEMVNTVGNYYVTFDGHQQSTNTGQDPLFLQYIGGRRGGPTAINEGGYHSKGIIGDRWNGIVYNTLGFYYNACYPYLDGSPAYYPFRWPSLDVKVSLFNTDASGSDIWINGMAYSPFRIDRNTSPLSLDVDYPYQTDIAKGSLVVSTSGEFINFDISEFFPLRARTGTKTDNQWYYQSGFLLGPFDRDVEIGLTDGQIIAAYTDFYINGEQLSHWLIDPSSCDKNWGTDLSRGRDIQTNQPAFFYPRANGYTILAVIPSGTKGNINIYSDASIAPDGDDSNSFIGIPSGAIVSLKTHVPLDGNPYDPLLYSGEMARLSAIQFVNNFIQTKYRINHDGVGTLGGLYEFTNYGVSGQLYPKPDDTDFAKQATTDLYGNLVYKSTDTPRNYWKKYAQINGVPITFSGFREGSRISFEISEVSLDFDIPPYQSYSLVVPSGTCIISGEMGYYAQADNSVYTEGFHLINSTPNDDFAETYNPSFVSEVLQRLPSGIFIVPTTPSGSGHMPVLLAPSVMKQREFISGISESQTYKYLLKEPPHNYNKLLWPALSDLETLNAGETMESIPPGDGNTFEGSTIMFSACQGQKLPNGTANPIIVKTYSVQDIFQMYDSITTDAIINSGHCITSGRGIMVELSQGNLSGVLAPRGTPLSLVVRGLF